MNHTIYTLEYILDRTWTRTNDRMVLLILNNREQFILPDTVITYDTMLARGWRHEKKKKRDVVRGLGPKNTGSRYWREKSGVVVCLRHPTTTTTTLHASYRVDSRWLGSVRDFVVSIVCCVSLICSPSSDLYNNKTTDSVVLSMSRF